jgi:superfamily II DNA/RNA helicase
MSFSHLGLSEKVLAAVAATGYTTPTPIQEQAIPHVLARRDVLGIAQTGTGKTAAFVLPMLTILEKGRARARMPRTLILEPTRELAAQVKESFDRYGVGQKLNVALLIGGVSFGDQDSKLTRGVDVLIATPGRLLDHTERGGLLLTGVELLVIDEADRMLDMGFIPDIERICKLVPFTRQTLFFTATMPPEIRRITETFLHNPEKVEVAKPATTVATITQLQVPSGREAHDKRDFSVGALHGDMDQSARTAALDQFRKGEIPLLVASDVAARGLDIPAVSHVFNFDIPHHADDYVHRIGRTGRAGRAGTAISIVTSIDHKSLAAIEKLIGQSIPAIEGSAKAQPSDETGRRERPRDSGREGSRGGRKPRRDRDSGKAGARNHGPAAQSKVAEAATATVTPSTPARAPSIGRPTRTQPQAPSAEPADHSHLPAFLLRPVRARV